MTHQQFGEVAASAMAHNARMAADRKAGSAEPSNASAQLRAAMLAELERFERDRHGAGVDLDEDRDPFEHVRNIADDYARHKQGDAEGLADFLGLLATDVLSLRDVRDIRLAAEAAAAITPRLIQSARDQGQPVPSIADDLGVTESYVYRQLRKTAAEATSDVTGEAPPVDEYRISTRTADQQ
ncbi:hypothetical protein [Streptomyces sp. NPDC001270]|uniref:hypothetical protein n=1 Tax=Streptomyces sp. NPDC001270 TaxID=3364554 RepID=UPI00368D5D76